MNERMRLKIQLLNILFFFTFAGFSQKSPVEIKYNTWDIHALRYYPFKQNADSIVKMAISRNIPPLRTENTGRYKKTTMNLVINKQFLDEQINQSTPLYKYLLKPYVSWLDYAKPITERSQDPNLTIFLSEQCEKENRKPEFSRQGLFGFFSSEDIDYFLDEWVGKIDIFEDKNDVLFSTVKSPLSETASDIYSYFISSRMEIEGIPVYEVVFFSKHLKVNAFEGYLYFSEKDLSFVKAVFTLNYTMNSDVMKKALFIQTPTESENFLYLGNDLQAGLLVNQSILRSDKIADSLIPPPLTGSEKEISALIDCANRTPAYRNLEKALSLLLTNRIGFAGNKVELGHVSQMVHYNDTEGLRLRVSGNTTLNLNRHLLAGGYLAYGFLDKQWKYRGDVSYSHHRGNQLKLSYVKDLNIPGFNLLDDERDQIFNSVYHSGKENLSLQKIGQLSYENLFLQSFSLKINAKYWTDQLVGHIPYMIVNQKIFSIINEIANMEVGISLRFAPKERYFRLSDRHVVFRKPDWDLALNHRLGIKGVFGSDYNYRITDFSLYRRFGLPANTGSFDICISGGKVWDHVPFPMLFIPTGNQSYVFETKDYNMMNYGEFVTDRFIAGNADLLLNWSPVKFVLPKNKIKTHLGVKTIYGSLSNNNTPALHPELFIFNDITNALGSQPYVETNVGFENIIKFLRIDYVHRLTYKNRGALFFSVSVNF
jgi:hypothetical protein